MRTTTIPARIRGAAASTVAAAGGVLLILGLAACSPTPAPTELNTDGLETSMLDWRQKVDDCMKDAGFDLGSSAGGESSPTVDTSQFDMVEFEKAYGACIDEIGAAPVDESLPTQDEIFESQLVFAACMRDAGYDYPDPVKGDGGMTSAFGPETDPNDIDKCSAEAQEQTPGGSQ